MENSKIIEELGLSKQEANTYLALLKLGGSNASLVAKEVGVKRTAIYPILTSLANKGAATVYFRKNNKFFYAQKPHKLQSLFEKKLESFESIIPFLESMEKKEVQKVGLRFIETKGELENFYNEILIEYANKEYCIIGSAPAWEGIDTEYFMQFRKERAKNNIRTRILLSSDSKKNNPVEKELLREYKYLSEEYEFKSTIDIFNDKILIVSPELSSLAVVIAIPAMVDVFQSVFKIIWNSMEEIKHTA